MLNIFYEQRLLKNSHAYQHILAHLHLFHTFVGGLMRQKLANFSKNLTFIYLFYFFYLPFLPPQRYETGVYVSKCFDMHATISVVCAHITF